MVPLVYEELRKLAIARMSYEAPGQTLQPNALVHEAWLRLVSNGANSWQNRAHFFAAAAEIRLTDKTHFTAYGNSSLILLRV